MLIIFAIAFLHMGLAAIVGPFPVSSLMLLNVFLFRYQKVQLFILKIVGIIFIYLLFYHITDKGDFSLNGLIQSLTHLESLFFLLYFILIYLSHRAISKDKSIIDSSNRLR